MIDIRLPWLWLYLGVDHEARWLRRASAGYALHALVLPKPLATLPGEMTRGAWRISLGCYFLPFTGWSPSCVDSSSWTGRPHGEWRFWRRG